MQQPKQAHYKQHSRNPGQGILLLASSSPDLIAYCDLNWVAWRSISGFLIKMGESLIS